MKVADFEEVRQFIKRLSSERYRVCILIKPARSSRDKLIKDITRKIGGKYCNVLMDVLPKIKEPPLGAYNTIDFLEWLEEEVKRDSRVLVVDEIEPLMSTFPKGVADTVDLFKSLVNLEVRGVVVIATWLRNLVNSSQFPGERIYMLN